MCESEIKQKITMGKSAIQRLEKIWKDKNVKLDTTTKLVKMLIFPVALYGCETWVMKKRERKRVDVFELWYWKRMLKISWTERKKILGCFNRLNLKEVWRVK